MESARTSTPAAAPQTLAMTEPTGPTADELKDNVGTVDTERALNLSPAGEKEVQQRLTVIDFYKGPATGTLDDANSVSARRMAEEARLRADLVPRFRAACRAEGGQRDRISEVPCGSAGGRARRSTGAAPRDHQAFAQTFGDASGETVKASDARSTYSQANERESDPNRRAGCASASAACISRREPFMEEEGGIAGAAERPRFRRPTARILGGRRGRINARRLPTLLTSLASSLER